MPLPKVTEAFDLKKANLIRIKKESKDASAEDPKSAVNVILRLYPGAFYS